jgi:hypothetical protein
MDWFRSWHGAPTDTKFLVIARRANVAPGMVSAVYWALLDHASQNNPRGCVDGFDTEAYAAWAGWEESDVIAIVAAFVVKETIKDGKITSWEKRQPKREDDSGPRVKRYRDNQRAASVTSESVTQSNVTVTHGNAPDKNQREDQKDERLARPPASAPQSPEPQNDPEHGVALSKLEALGMITGTTLLEFNALWPDLGNGRRAWVDDAVTVAQANGASSPAYAVRVLANAVRSGKRPGQVPEQPARQARPQGRDLKKLLGITEEDEKYGTPFARQAPA